MIGVQLKVRVASGYACVRWSGTSSLGLRRLVAAMAPPSKGKRRQVWQVAALHGALVICPSFARIL